MKRIFPVIILLVLLVVVIVFIRGESTKAPQSSLVSVPNQALPFNDGTSGNSQVIRNEFSNVLSSINNITIDTSVLQNPAFQYLRDHPISLGTDIIGRVNPFAPVGTDLAQGDARVQVQTLQPGKITSTTAEFGAQITLPDTVPGTASFEYGTSDLFDTSTTLIPITKSGTTLITATGLLPETLYYVRAVVIRGPETITGNTMSFTTTKARVKSR